MLKLLSLLGFLFPAHSFAQSTYLSVGTAKTKKAVIALTASTHEAASTALGNQVEKTIETDLTFIDTFKLLPTAGFPQNRLAAVSGINFEEWLKSGTDFISFAQTRLEDGQMVYDLHLVNVGGKQEVLTKRYRAPTSDVKILAHSIANDIVFAITGKKGIFLTKILFACDKTGKKEIYSMNFDGSEARQVTHLRSIAMSPAWSPDGNQFAFSVYTRHSDNTKNLDLMQYSFKTGKLETLSNKKGINSGASYAPSGEKLALTLSFGGNPDIYLLDTGSKTATQLTQSLGFDVDPAFSPDGSKIAFVSSRAGKPMVYLMSVSNPAGAKRLTYAGQYNASPMWSPDGKKLVFAGWIDRHFDLFTIHVETMQIDRLTKDEGNNEDPSYSPDGSLVAFSSNRSQGKNIWVMTADGQSAKRLTFGMGNCVAPKWSPYLQ